ncbi:MAG: PHP domain-containing protein [Clostridia bacterium]
MVDLHIHTTASDGSVNPGKLVEMALERGLSAIAVTDHDTIGGVEQALEAGRRLGLPVVPGVELGVDYIARETHILGYFSEKNYLGINRYFNWILEKRHERNRSLINNLTRAGFDISLEEMYEKAGDGTPGRPHLAKCLIENGYASDVNEAFDKILLREDIYIPREKTTPESAIREIAANNGIAVLAHPVYLDREGLFETALSDFMDMGLGGIEVFHTDHDEADTVKFLKAAKKNNLVITGGSDFHGANKENAFLGLPQVDDSFYRRLMELL